MNLRALCALLLAPSLAPAVLAAPGDPPAPPAARPNPAERPVEKERILAMPGLFQSLDAPKFVKASEAKGLADTDEVLGVSRGKESRAYPVRMLAWHHIANDTLDNKPLLVSY
jgi:hypothetical protein